MKESGNLAKPTPERPLRNKRRELFCQLYSGEFWGRPAEALLAAKFKPKQGQAEKTAAALLDEPEVEERVKALRGRKAERSIADPAWIRDSFVEIVRKAEKDSDKIRALAGLQKAIAPQSPKRRAQDESVMEQIQLPLFEGGDDGASEP